MATMQIEGKISTFQSRAKQDGLSNNKRVVYFQMNNAEMRVPGMSQPAIDVEIKLDVASETIRALHAADNKFAIKMLNKKFKIVIE